MVVDVPPTKYISNRLSIRAAMHAQTPSHINYRLQSFFCNSSTGCSISSDANHRKPSGVNTIIEGRCAGRGRERWERENEHAKARTSAGCAKEKKHTHTSLSRRTRQRATSLRNTAWNKPHLHPFHHFETNLESLPVEAEPPSFVCRMTIGR
jgi:hypothetical protein